VRNITNEDEKKVIGEVVLLKGKNIVGYLFSDRLFY